MYFTNPILPTHSADPWIVQHDGFYYYCEAGAENLSIHIRKAKDIFSLRDAEPVCVWRAPKTGPYSHAVWAPELHWIAGSWFIYFAADDGANANHRMWVLQGATADAQGQYCLHGSLETEGWAIDGTLLEDGDKLYFVWSGWPGNRDGQQNLYIAPMKNPWTLAAGRTLLTVPDQSWERVEMPICEGPQILRRNGNTFIVYSASGSWCEDYCLGMLVNTDGDFLNPAAWQKVGPVFQKTESLWGLGHCSFVKSPCGGQDWILYHSKSEKKHGWIDRDVHAQPFSWSERGYPSFGTPVGRGVQIRTWRNLPELSSNGNILPATPGLLNSVRTEKPALVVTATTPAQN